MTESDRISKEPIFTGETDLSSSVLVCGAGGFIGGHLVTDLLRQGYEDVRAVDIKSPDMWYQRYDRVDNRALDLREKDAAYEAVRGRDLVFNLAADMGGMGFIENNKALCMLSVTINTNLLRAARDYDIDRFFYSSSACVYNQEKQNSPDVKPLKEEDAYPALPEDGYGWEKLFSERMCRHFREDFGVKTRVARFHNVYGPYCTYDGGREKAPAALTRKVIRAKRSGDLEIVIWGNGEQTRSFMFIDDCVKGIQKIMHSEVTDPLNLGSNELVTINGLVDIIEEIADVDIERDYDLSKPQGVDGRNSDNSKIQEKLGWAPSIRLREGMEFLFEWIEEQIEREEQLDGHTVYTHP